MLAEGAGAGFSADSGFLADAEFGADVGRAIGAALRAGSARVAEIRTALGGKGGTSTGTPGG